MNQLFCKRLRLLHVAARKAVVDADIAILRPPKPFERLPEYRVARSSQRSVRLALQHADEPHPLALLRARGDRPYDSRAAEDRDEIPSPHNNSLRD